jgi:hypothetical protein
MYAQTANAHRDMLTSHLLACVRACPPQGPRSRAVTSAPSAASSERGRTDAHERTLGLRITNGAARVLDAAKALRTSLRRNDALESSWRKPWTAAAVLGML